MVPGVYSYGTVWSDAFHVRICDEKKEKVLFKSVLSREKRSRREKRPSGWEYNIKDKNIAFRGLYPRWCRNHDHNLKLSTAHLLLKVVDRLFYT